MCVCVCACECGKCMHAVRKVVHMVCMPDSVPQAIFRHNTSLSNSPLPPSVPPSLSLSYFLIVYIPSTDSVCLFELFTFFRDAVIHWIYKYNSVCLCVVCMLDSKHSPCNDVQSIRCISCAGLRTEAGERFSLEKQNPFCIFGLYTYAQSIQEKQIRKSARLNFSSLLVLSLPVMMWAGFSLYRYNMSRALGFANGNLLRAYTWTILVSVCAAISGRNWLKVCVWTDLTLRGVVNKWIQMNKDVCFSSSLSLSSSISLSLIKEQWSWSQEGVALVASPVEPELI